MMPDYIAQCASLAMALEVSATPKPGNIDREHNYPDTRYEHFLASVVAAYPIIREAATQKKKLWRAISKGCQ
ncbi:MAG: ATP:dephospho-CoA triphosphoribosyl transferase [Candidatus Argoarchaeum ethanivorans]|uniref:ATP:dephospho-CoA triphosphoribosyl transferase n=1 Tax=Candidatus Argoarchaeum ethanivorans TaxID=2608793 RepID=A0A811T9I1_9EURY|nr:MAG: ATP:dephospho-CoA triphosphoribosyl transferase [Candidatus Argoarchaeum ethanivorans]